MAKQGETNVWKQLQLDASPLGYRLHRNQRYKGQTIKGAWVDCGVGGDGGSDLIGYRILTITPEMVGKKIAQFVAQETKVKDKKGSLEQERFLNRIRLDGGLACVSRSINDLREEEKRWL